MLDLADAVELTSNLSEDGDSRGVNAGNAQTAQRTETTQNNRIAAQKQAAAANKRAYYLREGQLRTQQEKDGVHVFEPVDKANQNS